MSISGPTPTRGGSTPPAVHVLVAVKDLARAKSRLSRDLDSSKRRDLVLAMLADTLLAASRADPVTHLTVVTPDSRVAQLARSVGATVFADPAPQEGFVENHEETGLNRDEILLNTALFAAATAARAADAEATVIALQADLPALQPHELSAAIAASHNLDCAIVVDRHGNGTSALIYTGTTALFAPQFGAESARRHIDIGAQPLAGEWPGLRTDVDTASDLLLAARIGVGTHTQSVLRDLP